MTSSILAAMGVLRFDEGYIPEGLALFREGVEMLIGTLPESAVTKTVRDTGDQEVLGFYQHLLSCYDKFRFRREKADVLRMMGMKLQSRGQYTEALVRYREGLTTAQDLGDRLAVSSTLHEMGNLQLAQGRYLEALALYQESLDIDLELHHRQWEAWNRSRMGKVHMHLGRLEQAIAELAQSLLIFRSISYFGAEAVRRDLAELRRMMGARRFRAALKDLDSDGEECLRPLQESK